MLLACSVNTPIHTNRPHLLALCPVRPVWMRPQLQAIHITSHSASHQLFQSDLFHRKSHTQPCCPRQIQELAIFPFRVFEKRYCLYSVNQITYVWIFGQFLLPKGKESFDQNLYIMCAFLLNKMNVFLGISAKVNTAHEFTLHINTPPFIIPKTCVHFLLNCHFIAKPILW